MKENIEALSDLTGEQLDAFVNALCAIHSIDGVRGAQLETLLWEHTYCELECQHIVKAQIRELISDVSAKALWWLQVFGVI